MQKTPTESGSRQDQMEHFKIHIKEHLASSWSEWFEGLSVTYTASGETILTGSVPDQSALHGLLARIRDLNLTLISVRQIPSEKPTKRKLRQKARKRSSKEKAK